MVVIGFIDTSSKERFKRLIGADKSPETRQKSSTSEQKLNLKKLGSICR